MTSYPAPDLSLSVVVPCHNEAGALPLLLPRLLKVCGESVTKFEIILVDDGSTDATWQAIDHWAGQDQRIRGLTLARCYGQQIALTAGLSVARGDRILIIDADLQDPPELLPEMLQLMEHLRQ